MAEDLKVTEDAEELSKLLDKLNCGQQPQSANQETAELLALAGWLQQAGDPVRPPQYILDQTVERVLTGRRARSLRRLRTWLYSETLGMTAAALLVLGFSLLPHWAMETPAVPPLIVSSALPAPAQSQLNQTQPPTASQSVSPPVERTPPTVAGDPAIDTPAPDRTSVPAPPNAALTPPDTAKKAVLMPEQATLPNWQEALYAPKNSSPAAILAPLILPGQVPDVIVTDQVKGIVRQTFHQGTSQEIIITQRFLPADKSCKNSVPDRRGPAEAEPDRINSVTVRIKGQEITIEGRLPSAKLEQIAKTLTP